MFGRIVPALGNVRCFHLLGFIALANRKEKRIDNSTKVGHVNDSKSMRKVRLRL